MKNSERRNSNKRNSNEILIKEMINANIKNTNDRLDNISKEVADLKQSLEFTPRPNET